ncbi:MAG: ABC transporter permease, partial [Planctomycetota bacterium]
PDSHNLYAVYTTNLERGWNEVDFSVPDFADLRERSRTMNVAATDGESFNLSEGDRPERLIGSRVTFNFFSVLGVQPAMGRAFTQEEEIEGQHFVAIISEGLWHRRFGADPDVLGSTVLLDGAPHTIVGVMPPRFWFGDLTTDIWVPFYITGEESRNSHYVDVFARLTGAATSDQAQDDANRIAQQLAGEYPELNTGNGARIESLHESIFGHEFRMGSLISTVAVLFLLLIACANVANLLLTHAAGRDREVAVRNALGAGRSRILRQFLTEALILSAVGGVLGLGLSVLGIRGLVALMPSWFPRIEEIGLSGRVLLFTAGVAVLSAVLVGLAPAFQAAKQNMMETLKEGGRGGTAISSARLRKALVIVEVSLALVLLVSSALLVQGFVRIRLADLGIDTKDVLTLRLSLPELDYPDTAAVIAFHTRASERFASIPGVTSVAATTIAPLQGNSGTYYWLPGDDIETDLQRKITNFLYVTPGYFAALDIPVVRGRSIEDIDRVDAHRVIVINEEMAELHWPGEDPLGREVVFHSGPREIVGVVPNTKVTGAQAPDRPMVYFSAYQSVLRSLTWMIEADVPTETLVPALRAEIASLDPNIPAYNVRSMEAVIDETLGGDTIMAKIMAAVALIALVLALAGVYGVMAYSISKRTQEMGIRLALGAQDRQVVSMVMRQGALLAFFGVVIGLGVA